LSPSDEEDMKPLVDAVTQNSSIVYHAPRQSGKTTRIAALAAWLPTQGLRFRFMTVQPMHDTETAEHFSVDCDVLIIDEMDVVVSFK
jgi:hypothetical protein